MYAYQNRAVSKKRYVLATTLLFLIGLIVGVVLAFLFPLTEIEKIFKLFAGVVESVNSPIDVIVNNLIVVTLAWLFFMNFILFLTGSTSLPIAFILSLPFVRVFATAFGNGLFLGLLGVYITLTMPNGLLIFVAGILPHGIIEIPALIIALSAGLMLSWSFVKALINRDLHIFITGFKRSLFLFIVAVPLMIIAGLVEWYITPNIIKWVQGLL